MQDRLKQRLVGILVLLALAAIFLPMVLDFGREHPIDTATQIPPEPAIEPVVIPEPTRVEGVEPGKSDEEIFQFDDSRKAAEARPETSPTSPPSPSTEINGAPPAQVALPTKVAVPGPGLNAEGVPAAWVLQIGSFKDKAKAKAITDKLLADGYKAFVRSAADTGGTIHRVYVGPALRRDGLLKEKAAIEKKYKLKLMLLSFEP
ncbi:MAG: SPOR domain-containing protein [Porticoccaceae bacterium]